MRTPSQAWRCLSGHIACQRLRTFRIATSTIGSSAGAILRPALMMCMLEKARYREPVAAAPDAFHGPAAIITAPVAIAGTIVSLPFRLVEAVFPRARERSARVIGAPVYAAGQIAEFPFVAVNSVFGVQPTNYF